MRFTQQNINEIPTGIPLPGTELQPQSKVLIDISHRGLQGRCGCGGWQSRKQQGTELASTHVLSHQVIWGGRPEVTRKGKPREAFAAPQPLCSGHGWATLSGYLCLVLEAHPTYSSILHLWTRPLHLGSKENQGSQRWLFNLCCGMNWKVRVEEFGGEKKYILDTSGDRPI